MRHHQHNHHSGSGVVAADATAGVVQENPTAGPVSYPSYDGGGGGGDGGHRGGSGGFSGNTSAESAAMYPVRHEQAYPGMGMGSADSYAYMTGSAQSPLGVIGPPPMAGTGTTSSEEITRLTQSSPPPDSGTLLGSPLQSYEVPQGAATANGSALVSDPFGDSRAALLSSTSGHGYHSSDALTSSLYFGGGSSSVGHVMGSSGMGGALTSSSGHGVSLNAGRSKSVSPTAEKRNMPPPSSYVPPRDGTVDSSDSGSGSDMSSMRGLFERFRSLSKGKGKGRERDRKRSLQYESGVGMSRSSGESMASRRSMSAGHGSALGHASAHGHGYPHPHLHQPSSLLNPPNPIPLPSSVPRPVSPTGAPPVPAIRYPDPAVDPASMGYYSILDEYRPPPGFPSHLQQHPDPQGDFGHSLISGSDSPYTDIWEPPTLFRSPSPVPTDTSSYVEGLLNPRMLPGNSSGLGTPGGSEAGKVGMGGRRDGMSSGGLGVSVLGTNQGGGSVMSLRDNVDYSRPISGAVILGMRSTTTFATEGDGTGTGGGGSIVGDGTPSRRESGGSGNGGGDAEGSGGALVEVRG
ncbi:hypothetical protein P691DRAFT_292067 [Macrolepiota fuliginosa MF-IS2]|uniref:Uncharacterized protein n=1 Tax=Macrolepiota fuliginosa MF-IS2 TaxID=1400762 RepID=A0A9P5X839_9AGAR|nr:hypothetical protein P691DRAFT_292067 [Macrolepiota fuliginosa MF-IS2]